MVHIGNDWDGLLKGEFNKDYYKRLRRFLIEEYQAKTVYPSMYDIFNALKYTSFEETKVVILGQDPYHGPGQAHGLCFSVMKGVKKPPSLENIFKELSSDMNTPIPKHGCLKEWAVKGVMLLNTVLTVRKGEANSHKGKGWEVLTDKIIETLNTRENPMVFMLWGANAKAKVPLINSKRHLVLTAPHPSPLSAHGGFFGCGHFSKANEFLSQYVEPIDWEIK